MSQERGEEKSLRSSFHRKSRSLKRKQLPTPRDSFLEPSTSSPVHSAMISHQLPSDERICTNLKQEKYQVLNWLLGENLFIPSQKDVDAANSNMQTLQETIEKSLSGGVPKVDKSLLPALHSILKHLIGLLSRATAEENPKVFYSVLPKMASLLDIGACQCSICESARLKQAILQAVWMIKREQNFEKALQFLLEHGYLINKKAKFIESYSEVVYLTLVSILLLKTGQLTLYYDRSHRLQSLMRSLYKSQTSASIASLLPSVYSYMYMCVYEQMANRPVVICLCACVGIFTFINNICDGEPLDRKTGHQLSNHNIAVIERNALDLVQHFATSDDPDQERFERLVPCIQELRNSLRRSIGMREKVSFSRSPSLVNLTLIQQKPSIGLKINKNIKEKELQNEESQDREREKSHSRSRSRSFRCSSSDGPFSSRIKTKSYQPKETSFFVSKRSMDVLKKAMNSKGFDNIQTMEGTVGTMLSTTRHSRQSSMRSGLGFTKRQEGSTKPNTGNYISEDGLKLGILVNNQEANTVHRLGPGHNLQIASEEGSHNSFRFQGKSEKLANIQGASAMSRKNSFKLMSARHRRSYTGGAIFSSKQAGAETDCLKSQEGLKSSEKNLSHIRVNSQGKVKSVRSIKGIQEEGKEDSENESSNVVRTNRDCKSTGRHSKTGRESYLMKSKKDGIRKHDVKMYTTVFSKKLSINHKDPEIMIVKESDKLFDNLEVSAIGSSNNLSLNPNQLNIPARSLQKHLSSSGIFLNVVNNPYDHEAENTNFQAPSIDELPSNNQGFQSLNQNQPLFRAGFEMTSDGNKEFLLKRPSTTAQEVKVQLTAHDGPKKHYFNSVKADELRKLLGSKRKAKKVILSKKKESRSRDKTKKLNPYEKDLSGTNKGNSKTPSGGYSMIKKDSNHTNTQSLSNMSPRNARMNQSVKGIQGNAAQWPNTDHISMTSSYLRQAPGSDSNKNLLIPNIPGDPNRLNVSNPNDPGYDMSELKESFNDESISDHRIGKDKNFDLKVQPILRARSIKEEKLSGSDQLLGDNSPPMNPDFNRSPDRNILRGESFTNEHNLSMRLPLEGKKYFRQDTVQNKSPVQTPHSQMGEIDVGQPMALVRRNTQGRTHLSKFGEKNFNHQNTVSDRFTGYKRNGTIDSLVSDAILPENISPNNSEAFSGDTPKYKGSVSQLNVDGFATFVNSRISKKKRMAFWLILFWQDDVMVFNPKNLDEVNRPQKNLNYSTIEFAEVEDFKENPDDFNEPELDIPLEFPRIQKRRTKSLPSMYTYNKLYSRESLNSPYPLSQALSPHNSKSVNPQSIHQLLKTVKTIRHLLADQIMDCCLSSIDLKIQYRLSDLEWQQRATGKAFSHKPIQIIMDTKNHDNYAPVLKEEEINSLSQTSEVNIPQKLPNQVQAANSPIIWLNAETTYDINTCINLPFVAISCIEKKWNGGWDVTDFNRYADFNDFLKNDKSNLKARRLLQADYSQLRKNWIRWITGSRKFVAEVKGLTKLKRKYARKNLEKYATINNLTNASQVSLAKNDPSYRKDGYTGIHTHQLHAFTNTVNELLLETSFNSNPENPELEMVEEEPIKGNIKPLDLKDLSQNGSTSSIEEDYHTKLPFLEHKDFRLVSVLKKYLNRYLAIMIKVKNREQSSTNNAGCNSNLPGQLSDRNPILNNVKSASLELDAEKGLFEEPPLPTGFSSHNIYDLYDKKNMEKVLSDIQVEWKVEFFKIRPKGPQGLQSNTDNSKESRLGELPSSSTHIMTLGEMLESLNGDSPNGAGNLSNGNGLSNSSVLFPQNDQVQGITSILLNQPKTLTLMNLKSLIISNSISKLKKLYLTDLVEKTVQIKQRRIVISSDQQSSSRRLVTEESKDASPKRSSEKVLFDLGFGERRVVSHKPLKRAIRVVRPLFQEGEKPKRHQKKKNHKDAFRGKAKLPERPIYTLVPPSHPRYYTRLNRFENAFHITFYPHILVEDPISKEDSFHLNLPEKIRARKLQQKEADLGNFSKTSQGSPTGRKKFDFTTSTNPFSPTWATGANHYSSSRLREFSKNGPESSPSQPLPAYNPYLAEAQAYNFRPSSFDVVFNLHNPSSTASTNPLNPLYNSYLTLYHSQTHTHTSFKLSEGSIHVGIRKRINGTSGYVVGPSDRRVEIEGGGGGWVQGLVERAGEGGSEWDRQREVIVSRNMRLKKAIWRSDVQRQVLSVYDKKEFIVSKHDDEHGRIMVRVLVYFTFQAGFDCFAYFEFQKNSSRNIILKLALNKVDIEKFLIPNVEKELHDRGMFTKKLNEFIRKINFVRTDVYSKPALELIKNRQNATTQSITEVYTNNFHCTESSKGWLEKIPQNRTFIIGQFVKKFDGQYAMLTVKKMHYFKGFQVEIYFPRIQKKFVFEIFNDEIIDLEKVLSRNSNDVTASEILFLIEKNKFNYETVVKMINNIKSQRLSNKPPEEEKGSGQSLIIKLLHLKRHSNPLNMKEEKLLRRANLLVSFHQWVHIVSKIELGFNPAEKPMVIINQSFKAVLKEIILQTFSSHLDKDAYFFEATVGMADRSKERFWTLQRFMPPQELQSLMIYFKVKFLHREASRNDKLKVSDLFKFFPEIEQKINTGRFQYSDLRSAIEALFLKYRVNSRNRTLLQTCSALQPISYFFEESQTETKEWVPPVHTLKPKKLAEIIVEDLEGESTSLKQVYPMLLYKKTFTKWPMRLVTIVKESKTTIAVTVYNMMTCRSTYKKFDMSDYGVNIINNGERLFSMLKNVMMIDVYQRENI